jgi:NhaA family Na+:H+ antiporter
MFRTKHLFVEMLEFRGDHWYETHRWNHGLEEHLVAKDEVQNFTNQTKAPLQNKDRRETGEHKKTWTTPHLPSISLRGMTALRDALCEETIILDIAKDGEDVSMEFFATTMLDRLKSCGRLPSDRMEEAKTRLMSSYYTTARTARYSGTKVQVNCVAFNQGELLRQISPLSSRADDELLRQTSQGSLDSDDPLKPDADEEAMHILIDDVPWFDRDVVGIMRLANPVDTGLEERNQKNLHCRFIVMIFGASDGETKTTRHREMGEAFAALLQDENLVKAFYGSEQCSEIIDAFNNRFDKLHLMPHTSRPTPEGVRKRGKKLLTQLETLKKVEEEKTLRRTQTRRWSRMQTGVFEHGITVESIFKVLQKYALPLLFGIAVALIWANSDRVSYDYWAGYGHGSSSSGSSSSSSSSSSELSSSASSSHSANHPTVLGFQIRGHDVTIHFIVNDIFMCFFFGLAAKEICEAFQPGGSLYPPTRTTVNVLCATAGGVLGPVAVYFATLYIFQLCNLLDNDYSYADYAIGWGIPTATDISVAWVSALCVFGSGHPAINYLLLLAIVDDGIGLIIIALAYPDPNNPLDPKWLLLILVAMAIAYCLRRLHCARWEPYVILAGPFAWIGLLYAALHPSLALVFVVPMMPLHIKSEAINIHWVFGEKAPPKNAADDHSVHHVKSPLHDFEEDLKSFVDFGVLFAFGTVNAGVQLDSIGSLTYVILIALLVGKTLGIFLASAIAECFNCPPPNGMTNLSVIGVGVIASAGLTVALFISGVAFKQTPDLLAQAKMGALLSVSVALVAIVSSKFKRTGNQDAIAKYPSEFTLSTISEASSSDDESLENVIVQNTVRNLKLIHSAERAIETKAALTRAQSITKIERMDDGGSDGRSGRRPSKDLAWWSQGAEPHPEGSPEMSREVTPDLPPSNWTQRKGAIRETIV